LQSFYTEYLTGFPAWQRLVTEDVRWWATILHNRPVPVEADFLTAVLMSSAHGADYFDTACIRLVAQGLVAISRGAGVCVRRLKSPLGNAALVSYLSTKRSGIVVESFVPSYFHGNKLRDLIGFYTGTHTSVLNLALVRRGPQASLHDVDVEYADAMNAIVSSYSRNKALVKQLVIGSRHMPMRIPYNTYTHAPAFTLAHVRRVSQLYPDVFVDLSVLKWNWSQYLSEQDVVQLIINPPWPTLRRLELLLPPVTSFHQRLSEVLEQAVREMKKPSVLTVLRMNLTTAVTKRPRETEAAHLASWVKVIQSSPHMAHIRVDNERERDDQMEDSGDDNDGEPEWIASSDSDASD
jgi:hypothetical protein